MTTVLAMILVNMMMVMCFCDGDVDDGVDDGDDDGI
jgi:hypothetical protein